MKPLSTTASILLGSAFSMLPAPALGSTLWMAPRHAAGCARESDEALGMAWKRFMAIELASQEAVVAEIRQLAEASQHADLAPLVKAAFKARRSLRARPRGETPVYDAMDIAKKEAKGGRGLRHVVSPTDPMAEQIYERYRPWENLPPLHTEFLYDFASGKVTQAKEPLTPFGRLSNSLDGWPPYADALIAHLSADWDTRRKEFEKLAEHYAHAYCDLSGRIFPKVTLYDALASQEKLDMPDVDVIPFARNILGDRSYRSPIPASARRERLYRKIKDSFLPYFQHRSFIETAALLYVYPDAEFRDQHEGLRQNLLYCFAVFDQDPAKIRKFIIKAQDRGGLMDETLQLVRKDPSWSSKVARLKSSRIAARWEMHALGREVMRRHGLLKDR